MSEKLTRLLIRSNIEVLKLRVSDELFKSGPATWTLDQERLKPLRNTIKELEQSLNEVLE